VILPWIAYRHYGDAKILEASFEPMCRWVELVGALAPDGIWSADTGGDWLELGPRTPDDLFATACYARSLGIVRDTARVLGDTDREKAYSARATEVCAAFAERFLDGDGRLEGHTQSAYAMALGFGILPPAVRAKAAAHLAAIVAADDHLRTGLHGTRFILGALSSNGHVDEAYRVLLDDRYPSFGHQVARGSTTIWERWEAIDDRGRLYPNPASNSFNHFGLGSVADWMFSTVAGISPAEPGWSRVAVAPRPGRELEWCRASVETPYGNVSIEWHTGGGKLHIDLGLPPTVGAEIDLGVPGSAAVTVDGVAGHLARGPFSVDGGRHEILVGTGT
jgi:alpha-L-rhamnosidase